MMGLWAYFGMLSRAADMLLTCGVLGGAIAREFRPVDRKVRKWHPNLRERIGLWHSEMSLEAWWRMVHTWAWPRRVP